MANYLISKIPSYLLRLNLSYDRKGKRLERDLIAASRISVRENAAYDNWNGGMDGHEVTLWLPIDELSKIDIDDVSTVVDGMCDDLRKLAAGVEGEYISAIRLEMNDESDQDFQKSTPFSAKAAVNPDSVSFWKSGLARLFISHRDGHKHAARDLSEALKDYGISSFVAHDTIQPMSEWRAEIMKGLDTMEIMLVFLTDDFDESMWCHQEVGFALGKSVPIISLKLGHKDPPGFISHVQALRGDADKPIAAAKRLYPLIGKALSRQERLNDVLIANFVQSPSWSDTKIRFDRMAAGVENLTDEQLKLIIDGFYANDQLFNCVHLISKYERFRHFLERATGREFIIDSRVVAEVKRKEPAFSDDPPF